MGEGKIWRIEASDGRGPFRPGFSRVWRSPFGKDFPPPWIEAGISLDDFQALFSEGYQGGCGCRSKRELHQWFNFAERRRLSKLGFRTVCFTPDRILLETPTQVIFERRIVGMQLAADTSPGRGADQAASRDIHVRHSTGPSHWTRGL